MKISSNRKLLRSFAERKINDIAVVVLSSKPWLTMQRFSHDKKKRIARRRPSDVSCPIRRKASGKTLYTAHVKGGMQMD
jgi:hypothetical protein